MSLQDFQIALASSQLPNNDKTYFPKWLRAYAASPHDAPPLLARETIRVRKDLVITFLQQLRDTGTPAWQRLQALKAISFYQSQVLRDAAEDLRPIRQKLQELAVREQNNGSIASYQPKLIKGEGNPGHIDTSESKAVQAMRAKLRILHHPKSTEDAYIGQIKRFIRHRGDSHLERIGEREIADFLTDLAVTQEVSAGTQNQALHAILFYYEKVLGRDLHFINAVRARASEYRNVSVRAL